MVSPVDEQIIRTLLYFDIFRYPLKAGEIIHFLGLRSPDESVIRARINHLVTEKIIFQFDDLFSLKNSIELVRRRKKGNQTAQKYLPLAQKQARLISKFPFVRGVLASGSLSKDYMDENSDLDFFIITASKRLWIARTLLVSYKRLFLFNAHKYFCVNYFVDEDHLEIEEKNLFTATELATLIPLYGSQQYIHLQQANTWLSDFFPNYNKRSVSQVPSLRLSEMKQGLEKILSLFGDRLERYFQNKTLNRWKKLYQKNYSANDFKIAFKSKTYAAKNHDKNFQRKVMDLYAAQLATQGMSLTSLEKNDNVSDGYSASEKSLLNTAGV
jgi:hypothetical protein